MSAKRLTTPNSTTSRNAAARDVVPPGDPEPMPAIGASGRLCELAGCLDAGGAEDARDGGEGMNGVREHLDADAGLYRQNRFVDRLAHRRTGHEAAHQGVAGAVDDD